MKFRWLHALLLLPFVACSQPRSNAAIAHGFVDADGHAILVSRLPAARIVSTMQSVTEWIVKLGEARRLVARTDYDHEPELASLPSIGGGLEPSAEVIVRLKPDVILGWRDHSSADLAVALAPFHIPVLSFETTDTADVFRNLARAGELVGQPARADSLAAALRHDLAAVGHDACMEHPGAPETVLLVLWTDPPMTAGGATWMSTLLGAACLRNVFADVASAWPTVSLEAITARQPRWILTSRGQPGQRLEELRGKPGWRELAAVKAGRILEIPGDLFARAGPSLPDAARAIIAARRAIEHPMTQP